jgi:formylglycine-generating enzyme required for sulfatase activity
MKLEELQIKHSPSGNFQFIRGGSCYYFTDLARAGNRYDFFDPGYRFNLLSFRLVRVDK